MSRGAVAGVLLSTVLAGCLSVPPACPAGTDLDLDSSCYWFVDGALDHDTASADCDARGATLVSLTTASELADVADVFVPLDRQVWIGLSDVAEEGAWTWEDGEPFDFDAFGEHEPNGTTNENCVQLLRDGTTMAPLWNDVPCSYTAQAICEAPR